jgi:AcrR family transcriptional regulator
MATVVHTVCSDGGVVATERGAKDGGALRHASDKLVAAAEEFIDRGEIGQATVGAIADAAGVHRVTFYRHFPDKESLIVEVLVRRSAPVLEHAAQTLQSGDFFPNGLIETMATAITEARAKPGLLAALGVYPTDDVPHTAGASARFLERAVDITAPHVAAAQKAGVLRRDLSAEEIVQWLLETCLSSLMFRPDDSAEDVRLHLVKFVVPAIAAAGG